MSTCAIIQLRVAHNQAAGWPPRARVIAERGLPALAEAATLAIQLAVPQLARILDELTPFHGADCALAVVVRASGPDAQVFRGRLADIAPALAAAGVARTALTLVGPALAPEGFRESALYAARCPRRFKGR